MNIKNISAPVNADATKANSQDTWLFHVTSRCIASYPG